LLVSYRGYANSDGVPSEKGLQRDAQAALDYLTTNEVFSSTPIIVYGQSLGGAVATDLILRNPTKISAVILENTFRSLPQVVRGWPYIGWLSFACVQKWNSASKVPNIPSSIPILMLSGACDEVVPQDHMFHLWNLVKKRHVNKTSSSSSSSTSSTVSPPSKDMFKEFEKGGHADTCIQPGYWEAIQLFLDNVL
jgi:pimeloyl-ACP methyl ester carboxylesterase